MPTNSADVRPQNPAAVELIGRAQCLNAFVAYRLIILSPDRDASRFLPATKKFGVIFRL
jgi:hypothetical protein